MKNTYLLYGGALIIGAVGTYFLLRIQTKQLRPFTDHTIQSTTCTPYVFPTPDPDSTQSKMSPPIHVHVAPLTLAPLGKPMRLCLTAMSEAYAPNAKITYTLPPDSIILEGQTQKQLMLPANIPTVFQIEIQFSEPGIKKVEASAQSFQDGGSFGDFTAMFLDVTATQTVVREDTDSIPPNSEDNQQTMPIPHR